MDDAALFGAELQGQWLDAAGDALGAAFMLFNRDDRILAVSRQLLVYFPVSPQVVVPGASLETFLGAAYDVGLRAIFGGTGPRGPAQRKQWIADRLSLFWRERGDVTEKQGMDRWLRLSRRRLPSGNGLIVVSDPSEHKRREEHWRSDLERVQLTEEILDSLPYPLFVKDRGLSYVAVNKAYCDQRGMTAEDLLGKTLFDTMPAALAERFDATDRQVMETGLPATAPEMLLHADGRETAVLTRKWRLGRPGHYFLVGTVADSSRFDSQDERLSGTAMSAVAGVEPARASPGATEIVWPDRLVGGRILIVSDAAAFVGAVLPLFKRLGLDACAVRDADELARFAAAAAGAGIAVDLAVIDEAMQADCLDTARRCGLDALCVDAACPPERLAYLAVHHFNRKRAAPAPETPAAVPDKASAAASGIDVLVAEDNDINRIVFSQILDALGYSYVVATDGAEAVDFWALHRPSLVLMDTTLPVMSGLEAAKAIRAREAESCIPPTPIVGVLPHAFEQDRELCRDAGMDDVILKPISPDLLEGVFSRHLGTPPRVEIG